jgi:hypothetical protein
MAVMRIFLVRRFLTNSSLLHSLVNRLSITVDGEFAVNSDLRGFNLMALPVEALHHVMAFLPMTDVVNFAFVSRRAFDVVKGLAWKELDFSDGHHWLKDVVNLGNRAQATCRSLTLPTCVRYLRGFSHYCKPKNVVLTESPSCMVTPDTP